MTLEELITYFRIKGNIMIDSCNNGECEIVCSLYGNSITLMYRVGDENTFKRATLMGGASVGIFCANYDDYNEFLKACFNDIK